VPTAFSGVGLDQDISCVFRAYLEPGRSVSAGPAELLTERVLHVTRGAARTSRDPRKPRLSQ
jgi:hypothetical protein